MNSKMSHPVMYIVALDFEHKASDFGYGYSVTFWQSYRFWTRDKL